MGKLVLKPEQDGMGFFYGEYQTDDGSIVRVDVLPPATYPKPRFMYAAPVSQHPTQWIVYANGEEIAHVERREDVDDLDIQKLLSVG